MTLNSMQGLAAENRGWRAVIHSRERLQGPRGHQAADFWGGRGRGMAGLNPAQLTFRIEPSTAGRLDGGEYFRRRQET